MLGDDVVIWCGAGEFVESKVAWGVAVEGSDVCVAAGNTNGTLSQIF